MDEKQRQDLMDELNIRATVDMREMEGDAAYAARKWKEFQLKIQWIRFRRISLQMLRYAAVAVLAIGGWTLYLHYAGDRSEGLTCTTIEAPVGQRAQLTLPDGTAVWLNAGSKLVYPSDFSPRNREVRLEGEGFFEVSSDAKHPFTVRTALANVKVMGTKFNIKSYREETSFVTLIEGKVEITTLDEMNRLTLKPNEQASISATTGLTLSRRIGVETVSAWMSGRISYLNEPLSAIAKDMERRFNVRIEIRDKEMENDIFTSRTAANTTAEQVLKYLKGTRELDYTINGDQITIFKR
jgi:ferric-dicitrate binding protein FerR (iron transport regulator)